MFSTPPRKTALLILCAILFAAGMTRLFWMRFEAGDLYPPYSSLRGDPLGTQVLYESFSRAHPGGARRNFRALGRMEWAGGGTFLILGLGAGGFLKHSAWEQQLEGLLGSGGRLVLCFRPHTPSGRPMESKDPAAEDRDPKSGSTAAAEDGQEIADADKPREPGSRPWPGVMNTLGLSLRKSRAEGLPAAADRTARAPAGLPREIPWRSPLYFVLDDPAWKVLYERGEQPVVVEREWGAGSVLMSADSYLFSNEALRSDRFPGLLAWAVHAPGTVIFDEFHHGLLKQPGIASLIRKYRLAGVAAALLVVIALILWRHSAAFVIRPAAHAAAPPGIETGGANEGLVRLMERHIGGSELIKVCLDAWSGSPAAARVPADRLERVRRMAAGNTPETPHMDNVAVYKRICEHLRQGKHS